MAMVELKCPQCGGILEFEDNREFGFCQYCGMKIMIEKPGDHIVNNNTTNYHGTVINNYNSSPRGRERDGTVMVEFLRNNKGKDIPQKIFVNVDGFDVAVLKRNTVERVQLDEGYHDILVQTKYYADFRTKVKLTSDIRFYVGREGFFNKSLKLEYERITPEEL